MLSEFYDVVAVKIRTFFVLQAKMNILKIIASSYLIHLCALTAFQALSAPIDILTQYTDKQLLNWVQKSVDALFDSPYTTTAMKYHLLTLIKQSRFNNTALKTIYALAFLTYGQRSQNLKKDNPAITLLHNMTKITDWFLGILWQKKWQREGKLRQPLARDSAAIIYSKTQPHNFTQARKIIRDNAHGAGEEFIQEALLTYLTNDFHSFGDIPGIVQEEEATISQALDRVVSWAESYISHYFSFFKII